MRDGTGIDETKKRMRAESQDGNHNGADTTGSRSRFPFEQDRVALLAEDKGTQFGPAGTTPPLYKCTCNDYAEDEDDTDSDPSLLSLLVATLTCSLMLVLSC